MRLRSRVVLIAALAALTGLPSLVAVERDPDAADVAKAIRFEKAKQAAADRQIRIEEARARGERYADHSSSESQSKPKPVKTASARKIPPARRNPR